MKDVPKELKETRPMLIIYNNWRRRKVIVYETQNKNQVRTVGLSYVGLDTVDVIESKEYYASYIGRAERGIARRYESLNNFHDIPTYVYD